MRNPLTADERECRTVEYLLTLNKGQVAEFRLRRLNKIANFRKALMQMLNELIEARAEELAAGMIEQYAPKRPRPLWEKEGLAEQPERRRKPSKMPVWLRKTRSFDNLSVTVVNKR